MADGQQRRKKLVRNSKGNAKIDHEEKEVHQELEQIYTLLPVEDPMLE